MVKLLPGLLSGQAEKKYTRYHGIMGSGDDYCYLCWRPVQGETRYCSEHDKSTEKGCKKYNQDRKYLKQFNMNYFTGNNLTKLDCQYHQNGFFMKLKN